VNIAPITGPSFGWNIKTHSAITEMALKGTNKLSSLEKSKLSRFSQMPDLIKEEMQDMGSAHFFDVLNKDPSFGTVNDEKNNALSKFLAYTKSAMEQKDREAFLKDVGFAAHYLQDAATPPHTENGNYLHKLYRLPMHILFEKGKNLGTTAKLDELKKSYNPNTVEFSGFEALLRDTAMHSVRKENRVGYDNISRWGEIQQRCVHKGIDVTKAYLQEMFKFLPATNKNQV